MTIQEWKALCRMTLSTSTNSYLGHYKGVPIEISSNSTLTRVYLITNHEDVVPMKSFKMDTELPPLYRKVFRELYNTWHAVTIDNLPF
jgi:hypothetical protein